MRNVNVQTALLHLADNEALKTDVKRSKMSALAFSKNGTLISKTHNVRVYGMKQKWTIHAEERLVAKYRGSIHTILVFRSNGAGTSKPCPRCRQLIQESGVRKVIYFDGKNWISATP